MENVTKTPIILVVLAWLFVGVPWGWGIMELWKNARQLFVSPPPAATAPANATAPAKK